MIDLRWMMVSMYVWASRCSRRCWCVAEAIMDTKTKGQTQRNICQSKMRLSVELGRRLCRLGRRLWCDGRKLRSAGRKLRCLWSRARDSGLKFPALELFFAWAEIRTLKPQIRGILTKLGLENLGEVRSTPKTVDPWTKTTRNSPNPEIKFRAIFEIFLDGEIGWVGVKFVAT